MKLERRPIAYVLAATDHGLMIVNRNDYNVSQSGHKYGVGSDLLQYSSFDKDEVDLALWILEQRRKQFGDGVYAIDCGANIGVHTVEWAKFMYGWGSLLSVEAQEKVFYALAGNISINNCFNVRALWAAVGSHAGSISVPTPNYHEHASFGSLEIQERDQNEYIGQALDYSENHSLQTPLFPIDDLGLDRVDFIKMDIEGMELEALEGGLQTIMACQPCMLIEKIKSNEAALMDFFNKINYEVFNLGMAFLVLPKGDPMIEGFRVRLIQ
jgi:FkbM family methyltransferase